MRQEASLSFVYETEREAETVVKAVSPDNIKVPAGLTVETVRNNCSLSALVHCEKSLETFIATIDDLLACISVAERAFKALKAKSGQSL